MLVITNFINVGKMKHPNVTLCQLVFNLLESHTHSRYTHTQSNTVKPGYLAVVRTLYIFSIGTDPQS